MQTSTGCSVSSTLPLPLDHNESSHSLVRLWIYWDQGRRLQAQSTLQWNKCCIFSESNGLVAIAARLTVLQQAQRQRSSLSLTCQLPALQQRFKSVSVSMRSWLPILYVELKQSSSTSTSLRSWHQRRRRIKVLMQGGGWLLLIYCPWPSHLCQVGFNEKRAECVTRSSSSQRAKHASSEKSSTI